MLARPLLRYGALERPALGRKRAALSWEPCRMFMRKVGRDTVRLDSSPPQSGGPGPTSQLTPLSRYRALVLDSSYQPIDVVNWQRAICLEIATKVEVLEYYEDVTVKAPSDEFPLPAVLRVRYFSKRGVKHVRVALNRHNIFMRDGFECQYCGSNQHLTVDHVVPTSRGGRNTWENLVAACTSCNAQKGSKTLQELKWKLARKPREPLPHEVALMVAQRSCQVGGTMPPQWDMYLQPLFGTHKRQAKRQEALAAQQQQHPQPQAAAP